MFLGSSLFEGIFAWVGRSILKVEGKLEYFLTGSGDTTMAYISLFVQGIMAMLGTLIWTVIDRKRKSYNKLFYWFLVLLRIFLIFFLLSYGFAKIYKSQFPNPSLIRLLQPIGEMSPMGLAWTYMGHSEYFNLVVGFIEALGGLLLIPRRTQTLGALIAAGVLLQIFLMNMFYDIPVKIFSLHLLLMALFIFSLDAKRFLNVFVYNKTTPRYNFYNPINDKEYHKIIFWFKTASIFILVGIMAYQGYNNERSDYGDKRSKPALYGIWEVTHFIKNGDTLPPLLTDSKRWHYLVIDWKDRAVIKYMDGQKEYIDFKIDSTLTVASLRKPGENKVEKFIISKEDSLLTLRGQLYLNDYTIDLKKKDLSKIELLSRGYHWINEYPYNR